MQYHIESIEGVISCKPISKKCFLFFSMTLWFSMTFWLVELVGFSETLNCQILTNDIYYSSQNQPTTMMSWPTKAICWNLPSLTNSNGRGEPCRLDYVITEDCLKQGHSNGSPPSPLKNRSASLVTTNSKLSWVQSGFRQELNSLGHPHPTLLKSQWCLASSLATRSSGTC